MQQRSAAPSSHRQMSRLQPLSPALQSTPMFRSCFRLVTLASTLSCVTTAIAQQTAPAAASSSPLLRYVPDEILLAAAGRPQRLLTAPGLQELFRASDAADLPQVLSQYTTQTVGLDPLKISEFLIVLDQPTARLRQPQTGSAQSTVDDFMHMQAVATAMNEFYDEHGFFPDDDGFGKSKGRLSWRVHLLPYLEQQELYSQFRLEEPWDSEHNKTLIEKMPEVFKVSDIAAAGKTSIHVLLGEGLLFGGNEPPTLDSITDSPDSTILAVLAEPGTAEIWTRPGGVKTDMANPVRSFAADQHTITVCMVDGGVASLNTNANLDHWRWLIRHNDGHWHLPTPWLPEQAQIPPALLVRFTEAIDQQKVLAGILGSLQATEQQVADRQGYRINKQSIALFPDDRTLLISGDDSLKLMLAPRATASPLRQQLETQMATADLVAVGDLTRLRTVLREPTEENPPDADTAAPREHFTLRADTAGTAKNILELNVVFADTKKAEQFLQFTAVMQQLIPENPSPDMPDIPGLQELIRYLCSQPFRQQQNEVQLQIARPASLTSATMQTIIKSIAAEFRSPAQPQPEFNQAQALADVAEAFSTFHDVNACFPNWKKFKGSTAGLSWRVHLLQVLDPDLYIRFHMDEPWDSPHNKTLIPEMPAAFRTPGVTEPGKTSLHVFLGPDTICGADETYSMDELSAPMQNLVAFVAGPDTAEIWTKPTGLQYDPADPVKSLGRIGDTFKAAGTGQGQVVELERKMAPAELRQAIERSPPE
jgi:hypothetical protein